MPRTALTPDAAAKNGGVAPTSNSGDNTNGNSFKAGVTRRLIVRVTAPAGGVTVTFKAGTADPALHRGQGDLAIVLGANAVNYVTLDAMRFVQPDGNIYVDWSASGAKLEVVKDIDH